MYELDANSIIYSFKNKGEVGMRLRTLDPGQLAVLSVVVYELEAGTLGSAQSKDRARNLKLLLSLMNILPFDQKSADCAARVRNNLESIGTNIDPMDILIAGTALVNNAVLVTRNV